MLRLPELGACRPVWRLAMMLCALYLSACATSSPPTSCPVIPPLNAAPSAIEGPSFTDRWLNEVWRWPQTQRQSDSR